MSEGAFTFTDFGGMAEREMRRHQVCGSSAGWDIDRNGCTAPLSHQLSERLAALAAERDRLREAAEVYLRALDNASPGAGDITEDEAEKRLRAALALGTPVDVE